MESPFTRDLKLKTLQLSSTLSSISHWSPRLVTNWIAFQSHLSNTFLFFALFWLRLWSPLPWTIAAATMHFFLPRIFISPAYHHRNCLSKIWIWLGLSSLQTLALHCLWDKGQTFRCSTNCPSIKPPIAHPRLLPHWAFYAHCSWGHMLLSYGKFLLVFQAA